MDKGSTSELLFTTGVLTLQNGGITTTDQFESTVEKYSRETRGLLPEELSDIINNRIQEELLVEPFLNLESEDHRSIAELCALYDHLDPAGTAMKSPVDSWLSLLPILYLFRDTETLLEGVPESFIPIPAPHIPHLTVIYSPAIVYIWLDECPPCDKTKTDLESIFTGTHEVMPFAVYGPNHQDFLISEYEVTAGPVLLFMRNGTVETRLYGNQGCRAIKAELAKCRR